MAASDLISKTPAHRLETEVVDWTEQVYAEARYEQSQSAEMKLTSKLIDYIHGRQWSPQARFGRSRPVVNRLFRQFIEMTGLLTDIEPDFKVKFYQGGSKEFNDLENLLNEMITDWAIMSDFESDLSQAIMYGTLHTGFAKVQWNPTLRFGVGDNQFKPISPDSLLIIGAENKLQEAECLCYAMPVTMAQLKRKHGDVVRGVKPDLTFGGIGDEVTRPSNIADWKWKTLNPRLKQLLGNKAQGGAGSYPMVMRKEFWIKDDAIWDGKESRLIGPEGASWSYMVEPGMPIYPRGRIVVTAGKRVLEDGPNPYWHGQFPFAMYRPYRVPWQLEGLCYDAETEVLTRRGWLKFKDTNVLDEFATRQIGTGIFEWQRSIARTEEPYLGDMYHFQSRSMDLLVTPEHRMLVTTVPQALGGSTAKHGECLISAQNMARFGSHHTSIPQTSIWGGVEIGPKHFEVDLEQKIFSMLSKSERKGKAGMTAKNVRAIAKFTAKDISMSGDDYCAFMGAFLSEGWTAKYSVFICQHEESKGFKPYGELLSRILGKKVGRVKKDFQVARKALRDHCIQFGGRAYNKFVPDEIMNATPRQIQIFWDYYMLGDGHYAKRPLTKKDEQNYHETITTTSLKMADQLMELAQKMGYSAAIRKREGQDAARLFGGDRVCKVRESYVVSLRRAQAAEVVATKEQYDGTIYCVTVPNGVLYVRRNGKPAWCGNSPLAPGAAIQNVLNRIYGGTMDTINAAIEPTLMAPKAAFSQQAWDTMDPGEPGGKLAYNNNTPKTPEFRKPPEMGSYVQPFAATLEKEQDSMSGAAAIQQALGKKQVPGGDSLDMIMGSRSINIRMMGRELKSFLVPIGMMVSCNIMQFSTAKARAGIFGGKGLTDGDFTPIYGTMKPASMEPEDFVKRCAFSIRKGSLLAIEKREEVEIAFGLRKNKDISRKRLLRKIGLTEIEIKENEEELLAEAMQGASVQALVGAASGKGHAKGHP